MWLAGQVVAVTRRCGKLVGAAAAAARTQASGGPAFRGYCSAGERPPRILITGGLGQLGTELAKFLRQKYGAENVILSDIIRASDEVAKCGPYIFADILDFKGLQKIVVMYRIDWIIHFSALLSAIGEQNVPLAVRVNIEAPPDADFVRPSPLQPAPEFPGTSAGHHDSYPAPMEVDPAPTSQDEDTVEASGTCRSLDASLGGKIAMVPRDTRDNPHNSHVTRDKAGAARTACRGHSHPAGGAQRAAVQ